MASRQNIAKLIAQYELVKETDNILGDIVEAEYILDRLNGLGKYSGFS